MSGTGKSTVINELAPRRDWVRREDRIRQLLSSDGVDLLFLSGCAPNQGRFYPQLMLAYLLTVLDVDFTVEAPAELVEHLHVVAARYERAAAESAGQVGSGDG
jgi:hypothetical protein